MGTTQVSFHSSQYWRSSGFRSLSSFIFQYTVGQLITSFGIQHQQYAEDTQLFISIPPTAPTYTVQLLEQCFIQLHCWFCHNGLTLNPDKSEAIWFSTRQRVASLPPAASVNIAGSVIPVSNSVKILCVTLGSHLSLDQHVSPVCRSSYFLPLVRFVPHPLYAHQILAKSIVVTLVSSHPDYANSVLFGTSASNINKIQRVHNTLAKIFLNDLALPSVSALRQLHWLPINRHINFKIAILTHRALQSDTPSYLSSLINLNTTSRALHPSSLSLLHVPFCHHRHWP